MADIQKTVSILFEGTNNTGAALNGITGGLDQLGKEASSTSTQVNELDNELEKLGGNESSVLNLANAIKLLFASVVVKEFIDANVELERFTRAMTSITGSSEQARKEFEYIKDVANTLGLELSATAQSYLGFSAATKGTALEGEKTREVFEAVSKAMAVLGKSSSDTEGVLNALSQMVSKGTVSMEELRQQLGDRLYGAFQLAARGMGLTTDQLNDLVARGELASTEFLPKFAAELRKTFGDTEYVTGFIASSTRLQNSITELYQTVASETGLFDFLANRAEDFSQAIKNAAESFSLIKRLELEKVLENFTAEQKKINQTVLDGVYKSIEKAKVGVYDTSEETRRLRDQFNQTEKQAYLLGDAIASGMEKGEISAAELAKASKALDAALKSLGIDPKQFKDPLDEILKAFEALSTNPALTGSQFLSGFLVTLDKIKDGPEGLQSIEKLVIGLDAAQKAGKLSTEEYTAALNALEQKTSGNWSSIERTTEATKKQSDALKKQAEETKKAEEAAQRMRLELEKLASNERIAQINAAMGIAVAGIEADAQKAVAAFDSIGKGIESTGKLLEKLYSSYDNYDGMSWQQIRTIQDAIKKEEAFRAEQFNLQKELITAQIAEMKARTDSFRNGGGLIKIDGAGLQPHLEAFMWEILKTIQVRVNKDGLGLLLGAS